MYGVDEPEPEKVLFYNELNAQFPVEVFRCDDDPEATAYTVYKVSQGGYYYVFWGFAYPEDKPELISQPRDWTKTEYMCVYFSTYITSSPDRFNFLLLRPGVSTAADVQTIDPYAEYICFSRGRFMYCLLSEKTVLEIEFKPDDMYVDAPSFEHLVVEEINVLAREKSSCHASIWKNDFPKDRGRFA